MAAVYVSNLIINAGATFSQVFNLEGTETNSSLDLTGYTASAQIRKHAASSNAVSFTVDVTQPPTLGQIIISLTATQTSSLKPGRYVYDILITDEYSSKTRIVEGMVLVSEGVTR